MNLLMPEYNISKTAGSILGFKHSMEARKKMSMASRGRKSSEETKLKLSLATGGNKNPMFGKHHTNETKLNMSIDRKGSKNPMFGKHHTDEYKLKLSLISLGLIIKVYDSSNNLINIFPSITKKAKFFNVSTAYMRKCIHNKKTLDGFTFIIELKNNKIEVYDVNNRFIEILDNIKITSNKYNIPYSTLKIYVKSKKLYKKKFYFKKMSS